MAFADAAGRFAALPGNLTFGYTRDAVWLRVTLERTGAAWPQPLSLLLRPVYLDRVELYVPRVAAPSGAEDFRLILLGDHVDPEPGAGRPLGARHAALELPPEAARVDLFLRVRTTSTMALRADLVSTPALIRHVQSRSAALAALAALLLAFAVIHLAIFVALRRGLFLSFCAYLLATALTVLTDAAMLPAVRLAGLNSNDVLTGLGVLLTPLAMLAFARRQLDTRRHFPRADRLARALQPALALALLAPATPWYQTIASLVIVIGTALILLLFAGNLSLLLRARRPGSLLATLASAVHAGGVLIVVGRLLGLVEFDDLSETAFQVTSVAFVVLMSLSLVQRARLADRRRRESVRLRIARRAEQAARALVRERTAELERAKVAAETALAAERQAQAEQLRFVDVVTHQYQTPLAVIRSSAAAIRHTLPAEDADNRRRVGQIETAIRALVEVLDVSLTRSRVEGVTATPRRAALVLAPFLSGVVARARALAPHGSVRLDLAGLPDGATASLDAEMVAIALANLIENAVKFSPAATPVEVAARLTGSDLDLTVADRGIGFPQAEAHNLAKRYFRASNAGEIPGSGLGLNLVATVARAHRGTLTLAGRDGGGTLARLVLPCADPA